jgi:hypothetical protein
MDGAAKRHRKFSAGLRLHALQNFSVIVLSCRETTKFSVGPRRSSSAVLFGTVGQKSFSDAADTLASISGHDDLGPLSEAHLRRQLCLEKMARLAAPRHESTEREVEALDRRIALLDLQVS